MGTITAMILVGAGHPNHDGIEPSHRLYLSENSRPAWILIPDSYSESEGSKVTWIPTLENLLDDALLMVAIHVVQHPEIVQLATTYISSSQKNNWVVMNEDVAPQHREILYQHCRELPNIYKLVVTVLRGSTLLEHLPVLGNYKMDVEVCSPRYIRLYSRWLEQTRIEGEL